MFVRRRTPPPTLSCDTRSLMTHYSIWPFHFHSLSYPLSQLMPLAPAAGITLFCPIQSICCLASPSPPGADSPLNLQILTHLLFPRSFFTHYPVSYAESIFCSVPIHPSAPKYALKFLNFKKVVVFNIILFFSFQPIISFSFTAKHTERVRVSFLYSLLPLIVLYNSLQKDYCV